ncbi:putative protein Networked (NET), actin-binding (NAB) [Helianthus annuus]|nr:putative protein Networked (NET), actin-binding (NAB) [Helianthus annuus]
MSMLNSESRRLYSWWWDSHISPKNSKWLQENLTDMDTKVKSMIKLIEEDADSFARRAEMYYKKRPELMKLVEEFYRAYRALAERYDYATSELRHAQKTLQAAFPDQEPFTFPEGSSSSIDPNDQKNDSFDLQLFLEGNLQKTNEKDKLEIEKLKKAVADLIAEKDELFVQYQCSETALKDEEIEEMKQKASAMEGEIEDLKAQLLAYTPVIASLKENISSLEHNVFTMAANLVSNNRKSEVEDVEMKVHPHHHDQSDSEFFTENQKSLEPNGVSDLLEFQTRIAALEKVIVEDINVVASRKSTEINIKSNPAKTGTEESKSNEEQKRNKAEKLRGRRYLTLDNLNITKAKPEISESRKGVPIRDIPLDQASDGSSSANSRSRSRRGYLRSDDMMIEQLQLAHEAYETEKKSRRLPYEPQIEDLGVDKLEVPNQESQKGKVLHRLKSDAQKLAELETSVKDLTTRMDTVKKSKKPTGVDYETVKEQLEEAEETILQLVNVNVESTASIEKNPSLAAWVEQEETWKSSEKIKRVQLEVQKIQYVLLALDEKKGKGKSRFSRTKSVIMRDFIRRGKSNSGKSRRRRLCGCFTPSQTKGDRFTPSPMKGDRLPIRH